MYCGFLSPEPKMDGNDGFLVEAQASEKVSDSVSQLKNPQAEL